MLTGEAADVRDSCAQEDEAGQAHGTATAKLDPPAFTRAGTARHEHATEVTGAMAGVAVEPGPCMSDAVPNALVSRPAPGPFHIRGG
jgi:hypothetical protein